MTHNPTPPVDPARFTGLLDRVVVRLPANYEAVYRAAITQLEQHLATPDAASSRNAVRSLIEAVVVHAGDSRGRKVRRLELHGDLFRMLNFAEAATGGKVQSRTEPQTEGRGVVSGTPVVAGARTGRRHTHQR